MRSWKHIVIKDSEYLMKKLIFLKIHIYSRARNILSPINDCAAPLKRMFCRKEMRHFDKKNTHPLIALAAAHIDTKTLSFRLLHVKSIHPPFNDRTRSVWDIGKDRIVFAKEMCDGLMKISPGPKNYLRTNCSLIYIERGGARGHIYQVHSTHIGLSDGRKVQ